MGYRPTKEVQSAATATEAPKLSPGAESEGTRRAQAVLLQSASGLVSAKTQTEPASSGASVDGAGDR